MKSRLRPCMATWVRWLTLAASLPLLQTAGCVDIAQRSVINGFFSYFNVALAEALGVPAAAPP